MVSSRSVRLAGLACLTALYLLCLRAYYVGFFNDDAYYLIGARSLFSGGFRELNAPGAPPLTLYMPGYPLVLALWSMLAGSSFLAAQLLSVALTTAGMGLMWACFASELPAAAASAAVAVTACNPLTASISGAVLSDIPFLVMTLSVFLAARSTWEKGAGWAWIGLGAMTGAAFLIRPTGAALALALLLSLLGERRWRRAACAAAGAGLVAAPWLARNLLVGGRALSHATELVAPWRASSAYNDFLIRLARNARFYGPELFWRTWFRWPAWPGMAVLKWATVLLGWSALAVGLRQWGLRGWRKLLSVYLLVYAALHLELHLQSGRYLFTALPMAAPLFFLGLDAAGRRLGLKDKLVLGAAALSLALSLAPIANIVRTSLWRHTPVNTPPLKTVSWIRGHTLPADIFAADLDGRLFLLTGRRTVRLRKLYEPGAFAAWLKGAGVDYVLVEPNDYFMTTASGQTTHDPMPLDRLHGLLSGGRRVFVDAEEKTEIYQVR